MLARRLAYRVATVKWGEETGRELWLRTDPDIRAALEHFSRIGELLRR
jgi:hypothetical protein